ncbi:MAG: hypothetical protein AB7U45_04135 [Desulfamplus sp.]
MTYSIKNILIETRSQGEQSEDNDDNNAYYELFNTETISSNPVVQIIPPVINNTAPKQPSKTKTKDKVPKINEVDNIMSIMNNVELLYDKPLDKTYCSINENNIMAVDDEDFGNWLTNIYYKQYKQFINHNALKSIRAYLKHEAKINGKKIKTYNRIACTNNEIWIDINDENNNVIHVNSNGWSIITTNRVYFNKYSTQLSLPYPVKDGNIIDLINMLPLQSQDDIVLVLSWLIVSYINDSSSAYLWLIGDEGSGKTSLGNILKAFIDPIEGEGISLNDNPLEVVQILDHSCIPLFDNVSHINKKVSDLFCSAFSGGTLSKRQLYTDANDFHFKPTKTSIFTTRKLPSIESDLLDRSIIINMNRISDSDRKLERKLLQQFNSIKPMVFGVILDALVKTLQTYQNIELNEYSRIAEFQNKGAAAAEALGFEREVFLRALKNNQSSHKQIIINSNTLAQAVQIMMNNQQYWEGYAGQLLLILKSFTTTPNLLPSTDVWLGRKLRDCLPQLKNIGIVIEFPEHNDGIGMKYKISNSNFKSNTEPTVLQSFNYENESISVQPVVQDRIETINNDYVPESSWRNPSAGRYELSYNDAHPDDWSNTEFDY